MKHWIKWLLIIGTVCCVLGIGMAAAGVMMGGRYHWHGSPRWFDRCGNVTAVSQPYMI